MYFLTTGLDTKKISSVGNLKRKISFKEIDTALKLYAQLGKQSLMCGREITTAVGSVNSMKNVVLKK